ncbi:MAG: hypothetical protein IKM58_06270 [Tidjanibacter sp.]|nr:hypothetical protein [Tidjanibacter sp.]
MKWFLSNISIAIALLLCPQLMTAQTSEKNSDFYSDFTKQRHEKWASYIPDTFSIQYAGGIGMFSAGVGWRYGQNEQWGTYILGGFLPKRDMEHSHVTFTIKQQYTPWHIPINNSIEIEPLNCSFFANTIFGEEFWMTEPDKYPTRYYGFSTKLRFNLGIGQSINFDIIPEKRRRSRMISLYYELSVCELNIVNMFNRYIGLDDVVCLGVGIRYYK